jgi:hypothetical protein
MTTINKKVHPFSTKTERGTLAPVICEIEYDGSNLSITGSHDGGGGQIQHTMREIPEEKRVYSPGWTSDLVTQFLDTWDRWHLNDMRAGCKHQRKDWDSKKTIRLVRVEVNPWRIQTEHARNEAKAYMAARKRDKKDPGPLGPHHVRLLLKNGWPIQFFLDDVFKAADRGEVYKAKEGSGEESLFKAGVVKITTEAKTAGWVYPSEHPDGVLMKPCPVCGYKYGSAWLKEDVPPDVLSFLDSLPPFSPAPMPKDRAAVTVGDTTLTVKAKFSGWVNGFPFNKKDTAYHGHFKITLAVDGKSRSFDFYGSARDAEEGKDTMTPADMLYAAGAILDDALSAEDSFLDFCNNMGYDEDSRQAERIYKACERTASKFSDLGLDADTMRDLANEIESQSAGMEG